MEFVNKGTVSGNALVVGVNSYVTFEEAMQYVKTYFPDSSFLKNLIKLLMKFT